MPNPYPPDNRGQYQRDDGRRDDRQSFGNDPRDPRSNPQGGQGDRGRPTQGQGDRKKTQRNELRAVEGQFMGVCVAFKFADSKQAEQIACSIRIVEGPNQGQVLAWYGSFSANAMEYTLRGMRALGWTGGPRGDDITDCRTMIDGQGGTPALCTVEHHEWEGNWTARIAFVSGDGAFVKEELSGPQLARFQDRMRAHLGRQGGGAQRTSPASPPQRNDPRTRPDDRQSHFGDQRGGGRIADGYPTNPDDDIPF